MDCFVAALLAMTATEFHSVLILRSHAQHGVSKDGDTHAAVLAAILRDARKCGLLRMRTAFAAILLQSFAI
jgi:hypothetical protein